MIGVFKEYSHAILFVVVFLGLYFLLNTSYGFFIAAYTPGPDPITSLVARQVVILLDFFHTDVQIVQTESIYIPVLLGKTPVIDVYEGCNGVNVMIVFVSFVCAYRAKIGHTLVFTIFGFVVIHLFNLLRVSLLFEIALIYPDSLYFFHKYLFTGFIYSIVFGLWFLWTRHERKYQ